ncbi:uncharacterized lactam utilization protein B-like protein [Idiomarina sp. A28L]|uniref:5-oxoprolinase subunit PxpA n=1 Tax=Idiomarina sp. A28L TaxID=1036674 RepID=UPI0002138B2F|nr:5-oxoprolinase subunit PxpA [Idiomarina sp. A28L]EGN75074.1 uncharacterized lactam utilization protein B-like protein [Idiomarina sp. A28L]
MASKRILLNCDLGEGLGPWRMGNDAEIMPFIDCANIACGFHAGDPLIMQKTVAMAAKHKVRVGAHPAYPDLLGFGRRSMALSPAEVEATVLYQIAALDGFCRAENSKIAYVKPHGALYHDMLQNDATFKAILRAVQAFDSSLPLVILAQENVEHWQALAAKFGVKLWFEAFADRAYTDSGALVPRSEPGAVIHDATAMLSQALQLARSGSVTSLAGKVIQLDVDTLCVHGDTPEALAAVQAIRASKEFS